MKINKIYWIGFTCFMLNFILLSSALANIQFSIVNLNNFPFHISGQYSNEGNLTISQFQIGGGGSSNVVGVTTPDPQTLTSSGAFVLQGPFGYSCAVHYNQTPHLTTLGTRTVYSTVTESQGVLCSVQNGNTASPQITIMQIHEGMVQPQSGD